ncbi:SUMF1/EgtB/PvdO family nonheme iron enzyme [Arvimicrobium flavum]|uniref:SUMF1/EgtB/PvdO family nonheme iron enzyme n=1 Tax=Arvimicrobium flavum TaxID=3393320 RepID=UPI00237A5771|nr:SUMF1/EgtB/PvdO family nonheme iron enzyme [Mesorhizobium shangrilense]
MPLLTYKLIGSLAGAMAVSAAALGLEDLAPTAWHRANDTVPVRTTTLAPGSFMHPQQGEFLRQGRPAPAPLVEVVIDRPLEIMTYQVSLDDYARCVDDGACDPADARGAGDAPVTGVSFLDATAYAAWYSEQTGNAWRLPTDEEWAFAAGDRFRADMEPLEEDPENPARAWLSSYQREVDLARKPDPKARPRGAFGMNEKGVADVAGNVWEWTSTCYRRSTIAADGGAVKTSIDNCGVHVVEGFHRTYMSNFIRDGKSGGCAIGLPPDNLGFRLVRG